MATITSSGSGNWSTVVNANDGDSVTIASGHAVIFDGDHSAWSTGLNKLTITGSLKFKSDADTCLMTATNVNIDGTGAFGNPVTDPIQRPAAGSAYRCRVIMKGTGTISTTNITHYGWTPIYGETTLAANADIDSETIVLTDSLSLVAGSRLKINCADEATLQAEEVKGLYEVVSYDTETKTVTLSKPLQTARLSGYAVKWLVPNYTTLSASAAQNATEIVLTDDLGLQQGDEILIGCGTVTGAMAEATEGVYSVQAYNAETKTVTLTAGLGTARSEDDYVAWYSRPTQIERTPSGTTGLFTVSNIILEGVKLKDTKGSSTVNAWTLKGCTMDGGAYGFTEGGAGHYMEDCTGNSIGLGGLLYKCNASTLKNCININSGYGLVTTGGVVYLYKCVGLNSHSLATSVSGCKFAQCVGRNNSTADINSPYECMIYDGKLESTVQFGNYRGTTVRKWINNESFDHNDQAGYYRACMKGGYIYTDDTLTGSDAPHNPSLKFVLEENNPVFREYEGMYFPENEKKRIIIPVKKDFSGGIVKAQIILPKTDTMIDEFALPLAEDKMTDTVDTWENLVLEYKSTYTRPLTIRIYAQNASGNVWVDTANLRKYGVERLLQPKKNFIFS
jgi:peptidyl-tRNA hydrolase